MSHATGSIAGARRSGSSGHVDQDSEMKVSSQQPTTDAMGWIVHGDGWFNLQVGAERVGETVSRLTGAERVLPQLRYELTAMAERHRA